MGSGADAVDANMDVKDSKTFGGSFGGAGGDDIGLRGSPPRDSAKGKGAVVEEEMLVEVQTGPVEFQPAVGSSRHEPVSKGDFAKFADDAMLAQLL